MEKFSTIQRSEIDRAHAEEESRRSESQPTRLPSCSLLCLSRRGGGASGEGAAERAGRQAAPALARAHFAQCTLHEYPIYTRGDGFI